MTAPLAALVCESMVPILFTPVDDVPVRTQPEPFQMKLALPPAEIVLPYMVKLALPLSELTNATRPEVAVVGAGNVKVCPAVVCVISNVVATSTVAAAVPIAPPVA